jgi:hypothetical protein
LSIGLVRVGRIWRRKQSGGDVFDNGLVKRSDRLILREGFDSAAVFVKIGKFLGFGGISRGNSDVGRGVRGVREVQIIVQKVV